MQSRPIQLFVLLVSVCLLTAGLAAQDQTPNQDPPPEHNHMAMAPPGDDWSWTTDANVFVGYNYQQRLFANFAAIASQNWFMLQGSGKVGPGRLTMTGMMSLEPLTIGRFVYVGDGLMQRAYGTSPTGQRVPLADRRSSFRRAKLSGPPFINVQHHYDLVMGLGATYRCAADVAYVRRGHRRIADVGADAVRHRESARTTAGAARIIPGFRISEGVLRRRKKVDDIRASVFRGAEPDQDDNRYNIEKPALIHGRRASAGIADRGRPSSRANNTSRNGSSPTIRPGSRHRSPSTARSPPVRSRPRSPGDIMWNTTGSTITRTATFSNGISAPRIGRACTGARRCRRRRSSAWGCIPRASATGISTRASIR